MTLHKGGVGVVSRTLVQCGGMCVGRRRLNMLRSMGLRLGGNRFICLVKGINSKGASLLGAVCNRLSVRSKRTRILNCGVAGVGQGRVPRLHHHLNVIFRSFRLLASHAMRTGLDFMLHTAK